MVVKRNGIIRAGAVAGYGQAFQQGLVEHGDPDRHIVAGLGFFVRFQLAAGRRGRRGVRCDRVDRDAEFSGNKNVRRWHKEGVFIIAPVCHGISRTGRIRHGDAPHRVTAEGVRVRRHLDGPSLLGKVEIRRDRAVVCLAVHDDTVLRLLGDPFKVGVNVQVAAADKDGINAVFRDLSHIRSDVQLTAVVAVNVHQAQGVRLIAVTVAGQDRQRDLFVVLPPHEHFVRHYRAALHIVDENEALIVAFAETRRNQHVRGRHREGDRVGGGMRNVRNGVDIFSAEFILHQDRPGRCDQSAVRNRERGDGIALIDPGIGAEIFQINAAVIGRRIIFLRRDPKLLFFAEGRGNADIAFRHGEGVV